MTNSWKQHFWYSVPCQRARITEIVRRASGKILEAGCNDGFLSQALREKGLDVTSVDIDSICIEKAKQQFGIDIIHADVNKLPFEDQSFDLVIGGEILEHLENPGQGLAEMFRVSKGWVIITIPIGPYWLGEKTHRWQLEAASVEHDHGYLHKIDKQMLIIEWIKRKS